MRWRAESSTLGAALRKVIPFANGPSSISACVLIEAGEALSLQCHNVDQQATTRLKAAIETPGRVLVPARLFEAFIRSVDGGVTAEERDGTLIVACGSASLSLRTVNADEWPRFSEPDGPNFDLAPHWTQIRRVLHAVDDPTSKHSHVLKGLRFDGNKVVGCSPYELARIEIEGLDAKSTVPMPLIDQIAKVKSDTLTVAFGERIVRFDADDTSWVSRLIEGEFPAWEGLIRERSDHTLTFPRSELVVALDRLKLMSDENGYRRVRVVRDGDKAILTASGGELGELTDVLSCGGDWEGTFAVEIPFLHDLVTQAESDEITVEIQDAYKPLIVREDDWVGLCMPVRPK